MAIERIIFALRQDQMLKAAAAAEKSARMMRSGKRQEAGNLLTQAQESLDKAETIDASVYPKIMDVLHTNGIEDPPVSLLREIVEADEQNKFVPGEKEAKEPDNFLLTSQQIAFIAQALLQKDRGALRDLGINIEQEDEETLRRLIKTILVGDVGIPNDPQFLKETESRLTALLANSEESFPAVTGATKELLFILGEAKDPLRIATYLTAAPPKPRFAKLTPQEVEELRSRQR
ncbi:MAG: hypothetical protein HYU80_04415 [Candidatus Blackburnbacteria bacterium]|nr:hypothetical protein [Candidatus Blackburnbacteria bacterium]